MTVQDFLEDQKRKARIKAAVVAYADERSMIRRFLDQPPMVPPTLPGSHGENPVVTLTIKGA